MELNRLNEILIGTDCATEYYKIIYDALSKEGFNLNNDERNELFDIITDEKFYYHGLEQHLPYLNGTIFEFNLKSFSKFHQNNRSLHGSVNYSKFFKSNLLSILDTEVKLFFTKGIDTHESPNIYDDSPFRVVIKFLSPLVLYRTLKKNNLFEDVSDSLILDSLLGAENQYAVCQNPIFRQGVEIMERVLLDPTSFKEFAPFWAKYGKILEGNYTENMNFIVSNCPEYVDIYKPYNAYTVNYQIDKSILPKLVSKFYFKHFNDFIQLKDKIPNPLFWILASVDFLEIHNLVKGISNEQLNYLKQFNESPSLLAFVEKFLLPQDFGSSAIYSMLSRDIDFEGLFESIDSIKVNDVNLSKFENYLLNISDKMNDSNFLVFYRASKLRNNLKLKNITESKSKI